ncbi:hypothetical protein QJS66_01135 [Kocuria rhizophila]|nr:hypothetical protein QJS66_01135 [Kocuria rhizophila]
MTGEGGTVRASARHGRDGHGHGRGSPSRWRTTSTRIPGDGQGAWWDLPDPLPEEPARPAPAPARRWTWPSGSGYDRARPRGSGGYRSGASAVDPAVDRPGGPGWWTRDDHPGPDPGPGTRARNQAPDWHPAFPRRAGGFCEVSARPFRPRSRDAASPGAECPSDGDAGSHVPGRPPSSLCSDPPAGRSGPPRRGHTVPG